MSLLFPQTRYLHASCCPLACRGHRQSRRSPAVAAACPSVACKSYGVGGWSITCDSLMENWKMGPPRVVPGWKKWKHLLCPPWNPCSWRALLSHLPVPTWLPSAQMQVLKGCRTFGAWPRGQKAELFQNCKLPCCSWVKGTAEHVPVLAVFQHPYRKTILFYKGGSSPMQSDLGLPI